MMLRILTGLLFFLTAIVPAYTQSADSVLLFERQYYYQKYLSINDTITINTWKNLKHLKDNLEEIVKIDNELIQYYQVFGNKETSIESDTINKLNSKLSEVSNQLELKTARADNDLYMIWILKTTVIVMIFIVLILIYLSINYSNKFKNARIMLKETEAESNSIKSEYLLVAEECKRLKSREDDFREELQKGLISNQEKLNLLQERIKSLESENEKLRSTPDFTDSDFNAYLNEGETALNGSSNPELNYEEIRNLISERDSLIRLAGKLQEQFLLEKEAHEVLKRKLSELLGK